MAPSACSCPWPSTCSAADRSSTPRRCCLDHCHCSRRQGLRDGSSRCESCASEDFWEFLRCVMMCLLNQKRHIRHWAIQSHDALNDVGFSTLDQLVQCPHQAGRLKYWWLLWCHDTLVSPTLGHALQSGGHWSLAPQWHHNASAASCTRFTTTVDPGRTVHGNKPEKVASMVKWLEKSG